MAVIDPSLRLERELWEKGLLRVAGVDEAGVGPLAGPVVAAACIIPAGAAMIDGVRDSKIVPHAVREQLFPKIVEQAVAVGLGAASVREIERLNVLRASHLAMRRALFHAAPYDHALIDGRDISGRDLGPHTAIIDGDAISYSIACASILAKVTRDRLMKKLALHHPGYGWEHNMGYFTAYHIQALNTLGVSIFHRRTYAPVRAALDEGTVSLGDDQGRIV